MNRTHLTRTKPLVRTAGPARASVKPKKPKKCKACRGEFFPASSWQTHCRAESCAVAAAEAAHEKRAKTLRKQSQQERKADKAKREALLTRSDWIKKAQAAFNGFIRARDKAAGHACICCNRPLRWGELGGAVDAGHYRSVGSAPHLRFDERNCHAQLAQCNRHGAGRSVDYRIGLIDRIGWAAVNALEADQEPRKHSIAELQALVKHYRAEKKRIEAKQEGCQQ
jgi:hypothetical protein